MNIAEWLQYEYRQLQENAQSEKPDLFLQGYFAAIVNAQNQLSGMTSNEPELASGYLPASVKDQTLTPETLRAIADDLTAQGVSGLNVALALDLITGQ